jgi:UDP-N-acetylmuramoyl-tripeptide--D-alanyl-D-alanine ligase
VISAAEVSRSLKPLLMESRPGRARSFRRVVTDSRQVQRGDLFVALLGEQEDGHAFVQKAVASGATGVLVQRMPEALADGVAAYVVPDTLAALQRLAAVRRERFPVEVIGVTGSVGKTTTKEITAAVLSARYRVLKNEANYNNEIGLPLTLLNLRSEHERAVLEMGMYALGEIRLLCQMARPRVGIVTNVGPSHLERLGSLEAITDAKAELVESLPPDGTAILNGDDPRVAPMAQRTTARAVLYGTSPGCDVRGLDLEGRGLEGIAFTLECGGHRTRIQTQLPGRHLLHNALAAAAAGLVEGLALDEVVSALAVAQVPLRLTVHRARCGATILDDTYNASPSSMMAAFDLLAELPGRRIAMLGDMRELGAMEEQGHRSVGQRVAEVADLIYVVGDLGRLTGEAARQVGHGGVSFWSSKEEAARDLRRRLEPGDVVLLKASRAMALETVLPLLVE